MCPLALRTEHIFLLSNYNEYDRKKMTNMIYALGGSVTDVGEDFKATHLVVPYFKITRKMVAALAAGLWIVQTSYVMRSYRTGIWEHEAPYEIGSAHCPYYILNDGDIEAGGSVFDSAPRMCREKALVKRRPNLSNWNVALAMEDPRELLYTEWLLKAGGASVDVYEIPLKNEIDDKFIDFAIIDVRNVSSITTFSKLNIPCVPYEFIVDSLCKDPSPDASQYDLRNNEKGKFTSKTTDSHRAKCYFSSIRKDYKGLVGRCDNKFSTLLEKKNTKKIMYFYGKDKFKITLNSQCGCSKLLVNSELYLNFNVCGNVELDKNSDPLNVLLKNGCAEKQNIGSYYPNNELKMKNSGDQCVGDAEELKSMKIKTETALSASSSRKRLPSPRYLSPGKRKKMFPIQGNTLDNYFIPQNVNNTKHFCDYSKEYKVDSNLNVHKHFRSVHSSECSARKRNNIEMQPKLFPPELIVLSSDEDEDSETHPKHKTFNVAEDLKASPTIPISPGKPFGDLIQENSTQNGLNSLQYIDNCSAEHKHSRSVHCSQSSASKRNAREEQPKFLPPELIIVLSSDEDEDCEIRTKHKTLNVAEELKASPEIPISLGKPCEDLIQENSTQNGLHNLQYNDKGDILKKGSILLQNSPVVVYDLLSDDDDYEGNVLVYEHSLLETRIQSDNWKQEVASSPFDTCENSSSMCATKLKTKELSEYNDKFQKSDKGVISHHNRKNSHPANSLEINSQLNSSELSVISECNLRKNNCNRVRYPEDRGHYTDLDLPCSPCILRPESPIDVIDVENCEPHSLELSKTSENCTLYSSSANKFNNIDDAIISLPSDQSDEIDVASEPFPALSKNLNSNSISPINVGEILCAKSTNSGQIQHKDKNLVATPTSSEVESDLENGELKQVSSASQSSSETSENASFEMFRQQIPSESYKHKVSPKSNVLSAEEVCEVQAGVNYSKLDRPWIEMGAFYAPQCVVNGPSNCSLAHGKKKVSLEQEHYDENFLLEAVCPSSAIELLQRRIDFRIYPSSSLVQYALFCVMERWNDIGIDALLCLHQLLEVHPPCAHGMLDYYKKIFFSSVDNVQVQASDGVFWYCLTKIENALNFLKSQPEDNPCSPSQSPLREESLDNVFFPTINRTNRNFQGTSQAVKLEQLFNCLDYFIDVMEADLDVGLLKNMSNLKRYICKHSKPLIAVAFWKNQMIGSVTARCKQLIKLYFCCIRHSSSKVFSLSLNRVLSMMAAIVYASERNTQPPKYPNVGVNCKEFSNIFSSILLESDFNMIEVSSLLTSLKPDWFRWLVCCSLIEKLYGRNMDLALQPAIELLKNFWDANQEFPDYEQQSRLIISETGSEPVVNGNCLEISPTLLKNATKKDKRGETRLHITCRKNHFNEVEELLSVPNINVNEKDNLGWTPLHEAALYGNIECVRLLLNHRTPSGGPSIDLRAKNSHGVTPLMDAVKRNHLSVAALLIEYGGRELLSDTDETGNSVLEYAFTEEMKDILNNAPDSSRWNVLSAIPMTLRLKLVILIPQIILFYMKFSEVKKVASSLVHKDLEPLRRGKVSFKFKPLTFKQDYKDLKKLQTLVKKMLISNYGLVDRLIFLL